MTPSWQNDECLLGVVGRKLSQLLRLSRCLLLHRRALLLLAPASTRIEQG